MTGLLGSVKYAHFNSFVKSIATIECGTAHNFNDVVVLI